MNITHDYSENRQNVVVSVRHSFAKIDDIFRTHRAVVVSGDILSVELEVKFFW